MFYKPDVYVDFFFYLIFLHVHILTKLPNGPISAQIEIKEKVYLVLHMVLQV